MQGCFEHCRSVNPRIYLPSPSSACQFLELDSWEGFLPGRLRSSSFGVIERQPPAVPSAPFLTTWCRPKRRRPSSASLPASPWRPRGPTAAAPATHRCQVRPVHHSIATCAPAGAMGRAPLCGDLLTTLVTALAVATLERCQLLPSASACCMSTMSCLAAQVYLSDSFRDVQAVV